MIEEKDWEWFGGKSHYVNADRCGYSLVTVIGGTVVSTIGDYWKQEGDESPSEIGIGRFYETMTFPVGGCCGCGCMQPLYTEQDGLVGSNSPKEAKETHMRICYEIANGGAKDDC